MPAIVELPLGTKKIPKGFIHIASNETGRIYVDPNTDGPEIYQSPSLLTPFPLVEKEQRQAIYISGQSGSGKSVFARKMIDLLLSQTNKRVLNKETGEYETQHTPVRIFSRTQEVDKAFADIPFLNKIDFNHPALVTITPELLKNSIVIFDDYDQVPNKQLLLFLTNLLKGILEVGRKMNIQVIVVNHQTMDYHKTKGIIFECNASVLFPGSNKNSTMRYINSYIKPDKKTMARIEAIKTSRFSFFYYDKVYPARFISDNQILLM